MNNLELRVKFTQGKITLELEGEASSVRAELETLRTQGLGKLLEFFTARPTPPAPTGAPPGLPPPAPSVVPIGPGSPPSPGPDPDLGPEPIPHGDFFNFACQRIRIPSDPAEVESLGLNLDADVHGRIDNGFGRLLQALSMAAGSGTLFTSDFDAPEDGPNYRIQVQSSDSALQEDSNVAVTFFATKIAADGGIVVDETKAPGRFFGALAARRFESEHPFAAKHPVTLPLRLALISSDYIDLPLQGAQIQFDVSEDGLVMTGALRGAIKMSDLQTGFFPEFARLLTARIQADPDGVNANAIRELFDTGGCTNPDGSVAKADDSIIDVCEISTNTIIVTALQPDIKVFDDQGKYAPGKGSVRDCVSIGVGFTATREAPK